MKTIYFAGGCFWGTEHYFKLMKGVLSTTAGYANGEDDKAPSYEEVCKGDKGFVETVKLEYDDKKLPLAFLVRMFFLAIDPTAENQQGNDIGVQYRTGIYYTDETDKEIIDAIYAEEAAAYMTDLKTEVLKLKNFYPAEEYHQDYLDKHPEGYCHLPTELFEMAKQVDF